MQEKQKYFTILFVIMAISFPALAQRAEEENSYGVIWLTGEQGHARAGLVISTRGNLNVSESPTVRAPNGQSWDLSTLTGLINFGLANSRNNKFIIVSATGDFRPEYIGDEITGYVDKEVKIDVRQDLMSAGVKVGTQTFKGKLRGFLAIVPDESQGAKTVLLPGAGFYSVSGTVTKLERAGGNFDEKSMISDTTMGLFNGKLTLGIIVTGQSGEKATYAMPDFEGVASQIGGVYRGDLIRLDDFGFGKLQSTKGTSASVMQNQQGSSASEGHLHLKCTSDSKSFLDININLDDKMATFGAWHVPATITGNTVTTQTIFPHAHAAGVKITIDRKSNRLRSVLVDSVTGIEISASMAMDMTCQVLEK